MDKTGTWYHVGNHAKSIREVQVTRVTPTILYIDLAGDGRGLAHRRTTASDQYFEHKEDAVRCIIGWAKSRLETARRNFEREQATYDAILREYQQEGQNESKS